jgi:hypothetical protein
MKPFSGTTISTGSTLDEIAEAARAAKAKKTMDLALVDFSESPE